MTMPATVLELTEALIACPSVTPAAGPVFDCLEAALAPLGFAVHRAVTGEAPDGPVENLFAIRHGPAGTRHFAFAGHLDVVPPGEGWASGSLRSPPARRAAPRARRGRHEGRDRGHGLRRARGILPSPAR